MPEIFAAPYMKSQLTHFPSAQRRATTNRMERRSWSAPLRLHSPSTATLDVHSLFPSSSLSLFRGCFGLPTRIQRTRNPCAWDLVTANEMKVSTSRQLCSFPHWQQQPCTPTDLFFSAPCIILDILIASHFYSQSATSRLHASQPS